MSASVQNSPLASLLSSQPLPLPYIQVVSSALVHSVTSLLIGGLGAGQETLPAGVWALLACHLPPAYVFTSNSPNSPHPQDPQLFQPRPIVAGNEQAEETLLPRRRQSGSNGAGQCEGL